MAKLSTVLVALISVRSENATKLKAAEEMASSWEREEAMLIVAVETAEAALRQAEAQCIRHGGPRAPHDLLAVGNTAAEAVRVKRVALAAWRRETKAHRQAAERRLDWAKEDISRYG